MKLGSLFRQLAAPLGIVDFPFALSICAIFRDEAYYLKDWLTFHVGVGVDHFYLYNNDSADDFLAVLKPWIASGKVTLIDWPGKGVQAKAYTDCVRRTRYQTRWIAFIDIDEYLFSPTGKSLPTVLDDYTDCSAVFVYWWLYGSSGNAERSRKPVVEACTRRFDFASGKVRPHGTTGRPDQGKSIVNPRKTQRMGVHLPQQWTGEICDESKRPSPEGTASPERHSTKVLRINHYWARSIQDLREKAARTRASNGGTRSLDAMLEWEAQINCVEDLEIIPLWDKAKSGAGVVTISSP
jgi:hypothetical protein